MGVLDDLLEQTREFETPASFVYWAGLCAISSVAKGVYLDKFAYKLYPNIYVLLVAKSGGRKGFATDVAKRLTKDITTTRIISGRNTIQAILKQLGEAKTFPNGEVLSEGTGFVISGELNTLLVRDEDAQTILTELYDSCYLEEWVNTTKAHGTDKIIKPYLTLFGATNLAHLNDFLDAKSIEGGFVGRTLLIREDKRRVINSLTEAPKINFCLEPFKQRIKEISKITGEFVYSTEAKSLFKNWYEKFSKKLDEEPDDKTGTAERIHDHALKVSMLLSLSRKDVLILTEEDMQDAINLVEYIGKTAAQSSLGHGTSEIAKQQGIFVNALLRRDDFTLTRKDFLRNHCSDFDSFTLDKVVDILEQAGRIEVFRSGLNPVYKLTKEFAERMKGVIKKVKVKV